MKTINAKLNYKIKPTHPDFQYITNWTPDKVYTECDTYRIDPDEFYGEDDIIDYIKEDLMLVAGGGYNWDNIYDVKFEMEVI